MTYFNREFADPKAYCDEDAFAPLGDQAGDLEVWSAHTG